MISEKLQDAFNDQITAEVHSSYLYLSMAAYFDDMNLAGMATWMKSQAQEELTHAMRFYNFINDRGGRVRLAPIPEVQTEWDSPLAAFQAGYKHECYISDRINKLVALAREENDYASDSFLRWFVDEQVEEEANADEIVQKLKLMDGHPQGLLMLDRDLGARPLLATIPAEGGGE